MAKANDKRRRKAWLTRVMRGNAKMGNPMPGYSKVYTQPQPKGWGLSSALAARGAALRDEVDAIAESMGYTLTKPRTHTTPNRWF